MCLLRCRDIMVVQVFFCQNLHRTKSILKLEFLKHFLLIKDMSKACGLDLNVALTKFPPHPWQCPGTTNWPFVRHYQQGSSWNKIHWKFPSRVFLYMQNCKQKCQGSNVQVLDLIMASILKLYCHPHFSAVEKTLPIHNSAFSEHISHLRFQIKA